MSFCACNGHVFDQDGCCVLCPATRDIPVDTLAAITQMNAAHRQITRAIEELRRTHWWQFTRKGRLLAKIDALEDAWTRRYAR